MEDFILSPQSIQLGQVKVTLEVKPKPVTVLFDLCQQITKAVTGTSIDHLGKNNKINPSLISFHAAVIISQYDTFVFVQLSSGSRPPQQQQGDHPGM